VIIGLKSITEAGNPSATSIADELRPFVLNQKKAAVIEKRISSEDLSTIASSFSTKVDTATAITFNSSFIPNMQSRTKQCFKSYCWKHWSIYCKT